MPHLRNATQVSSASPKFPSANDATVKTPISTALLLAGNSSRVMDNLSFSSVAPTASNADIPPPVLARGTFSSSAGAFLDQIDLECQWSLLKNRLMTKTLSEQEALAVLSSGILQTETGKAIAGLFADAMLRSVRPLGSLDDVRLKEIIDVLCHLPPDKWQAALGENVRFPSGQKTEGETGFIQSQLDRSSELRDERIANEEMLADVHWETLKNLTAQGRQYIRSSDGALDSALMMLEDASDLRPPPRDVHAQLEAFIRHLEKGDVKRIRWTEHYVTEVKALRDQVKPGDDAELTWLEWLVGPSWLEGVFGRPISFSALMNSTHTSVTPPLSNDGSDGLLKSLQSFERSADFYSSVTGNGPRVPDSLVGKLLYVCNALDIFNALRLDSSHISTSRPTFDAVKLGSTPVTDRPAAEPDSGAWKNGASDFSRSPLEPGPERPPAIAQLGQLAAQVDEILDQFARKAMPWGSAYADEQIEMEAMLEPLRVYQPTTETLNDQPAGSPGPFLSEMQVVGGQMASWLGRMSSSLISTGVAVLGQTGDLIERNPGRATGVFAAYVAISNLYASWSLPEPEQAIDPLQGVELDPGAVPNEEAVFDEYVVEGVEDLFGDLPEFANEVKKWISESDYPDPADDPQLVENLEALLQRPVPGNQNVTYQDYLNEVTVLAALDANVEFEADPDNGSTTEAAVTTDAAPLMGDMPIHVRKRRSLGMSSEMQTSESGVTAHASAHWLIQAGQRALDAEIAIKPGEEIAPGVTISQAADLFIKDYVELQLVLDPSLFILSSVQQVVVDSDLPPDLKSKVNQQTKFRVDYDTPRPLASKGNYYQKVASRHKMFSLAELMMGRHEKEAQSREEMKINWPSGFTEGFKNAVKESNLWEDYKSRSEKVLSQPKSFELWKANLKYKLQQVVSDCLEGAHISVQGKEVANQYMRGEIPIRPIAIKHGKYSDMLPVSNAVFLSKGRGPEGLFVFLSGNETVIESPAELFEKDGKSIEEFPELRSELSKRIPLKNLLSRDDDDFQHSQGRFVWGWNPLNMYSDYKWPYTPIIFGRKDGVTRYEDEHDAFKELFKEVVDKAKSDMDTMTSTLGERTVDKLLGILADALAGFTIILAMPGAPVAGIAFMMGASASGAQYVRGAVNDDPLEASRHKANAIKGMIGQVAGPYIGKVLGKIFSRVVDSRIAGKIGERLKFDKVFPKELSRHFPKYGHPSSPLSANAKKIEKWIAPRVRNPWIIQDKVNRKLTSNVVVGRLKSLGKGPEVAQRLMDRSRILYFAGPKEGYVYRGFTMRGDMRSPHEVFAKGFKSGNNSGVKTSGYYDSNGMGAYHQGGKQGGYTYLIDGRTKSGSDVVRNDNWKAGSQSRLGSNPYQVTYENNIPGSKILGAYDRAGKFIPNPSALDRAILKSIPNPFAESVPFPIKKPVQDNNSKPTQINSPHMEKEVKQNSTVQS